MMEIRQEQPYKVLNLTAFPLLRFCAVIAQKKPTNYKASTAAGIMSPNLAVSPSCQVAFVTANSILSHI